MKTAKLLFFILCLWPLLSQAESDQSFVYSSQDGLFKITYPVQFTENKVSASSSQIYTIGAVKEDIIFITKFGINEKPLLKEKQPLFLQKTQEAYVGNNQLEQEEHLTIGEAPVKQVKFVSQANGEKFYKYIRFITLDKVWYTLEVYSNKEYPNYQTVKSFFDSFQIL
jgi:hypothetical protein